jgi:hypothetical protein
LEKAYQRADAAGYMSESEVKFARFDELERQQTLLYPSCLKGGTRNVSIALPGFCSGHAANARRALRHL